MRAEVSPQTCLELNPAQLFALRSPCQAAAANHTSRQSETHATQQTTHFIIKQWVLLC